MAVYARESKRQIIFELKFEIFPTSQPKPWQVMSPGETATSSCPRHLHKALANCGAAILMFERAIIVEICFHFKVPEELGLRAVSSSNLFIIRSLCFSVVIVVNRTQ